MVQALATPRAGLLLALLAQLPFLARPPHRDEVNFLRLAAGAAQDPWRPHAIEINWQGTTERAFDVLSNPPGIGWWLAPWLGAPTWAQRAAMLVWLLPAAWGIARLGQRFAAPSAWLLLLTSPLVTLSASALLPDAPLLGLSLAGVAGFVHASDRRQPAWGWAMLAGCAALFRYSGLCLIPLLVLYQLLQRRTLTPALLSLLPIAALAAHDLHAYGALHLTAMGSFQSVANTGLDRLHKAGAALALLGGAGVGAWALPEEGRGAGWARWGPWGGALLGAALGGPWWPYGSATGAVFAAAGGWALGQTLRTPWLAAWGGGGAAFLLLLRFTAGRYWLPFLPAVALGASPRSRAAAWLSAGCFGLLGVGLLADEAQEAAAVAALAHEALDVASQQTSHPRVFFVGHWGWQGVMEAGGATPLDEGQVPPLGALLATVTEAWPQATPARCGVLLWSGEARPARPWLPRSYAPAARANLHANFIAVDGRPSRTLLPWAFSDGPYERAALCDPYAP